MRSRNAHWAIGVCVAKGLLWLIAIITNLAIFRCLAGQILMPAQNHLGWWLLLVPVVGALVIGMMARYGSEKIRGHGIPETLEAILLGRSLISLKVAIPKPLSSAISIGTGGPFGAEGPIIMTGGAFGSLFAQLFRLSAAERKTLLVAGAASGMSAVFATPVAAVLLAVELLLFEWKPRSFIPVAVASIVASILRVPLLGAGPMFPVASHGPLEVNEIVAALLIGVASGFGSWLLTTTVYAFEDLLRALQDAAAGDVSVIEAGKTDLVVTYPDELLHDAVAKMLRHNIGRLPVMKRNEPKSVVGYLGRADILGARMRLHEEEESRSKGPIGKWPERLEILASQTSR